MVDSISSIGQTQSMMSFRQVQSLTDDQKSEVTSILSQYDTDNLTSSDAKSILDAFKEAGIGPSKSLADTVKSSGFDMKSILSLAKPEDSETSGTSTTDETSGTDETQDVGEMPPPPPPPPPSGQDTSTSSSNSSLSVSALKNLQSILSNYDLTNLSEDDQSSLVSQLSKAGLMQSGNLIDISA